MVCFVLLYHDTTLPNNHAIHTFVVVFVVVKKKDFLCKHTTSMLSSGTLNGNDRYNLSDAQNLIKSINNNINILLYYGPSSSFVSLYHYSIEYCRNTIVEREVQEQYYKRSLVLLVTVFFCYM
jgi:hypothetical protein